MTITMKYEYKAGGYPTPTYRGRGEVSINVESEREGIRDELLRRAKNRVSRDLAMDAVMVEIVDYSIH